MILLNRTDRQTVNIMYFQIFKLTNSSGGMANKDFDKSALWN